MRRGQAAMEFLSTYGWAIMVVLIAIGALSYFGVTNPKNLIPEKCIVSSGFSCNDYQALSGTGGDEIKIFLTNNLGEPITIQQGTFTVITSQETIPANDCEYRLDGGTLVNADTNDLSLGSSRTFEVYCDPAVSLTAQEKEQLDFSFTYISVGGRYAHVVTGEILATVQ